MILKDLETVGDKTLKKEIDEQPPPMDRVALSSPVAISKFGIVRFVHRNEGNLCKSEITFHMQKCTTCVHKETCNFYIYECVYLRYSCCEPHIRSDSYEWDLPARTWKSWSRNRPGFCGEQRVFP